MCNYTLRILAFPNEAEVVRVDAVIDIELALEDMPDEGCDWDTLKQKLIKHILKWYKKNKEISGE